MDKRTTLSYSEPTSYLMPCPMKGR